MFIKKELNINVEKSKKKGTMERKTELETEIKVIVETAIELDVKRATREFYKVVKSERL